MAWPITLTKPQSSRLFEAVELFHREAVNTPTVPRPFVLQLSIILSMMDRGLSLDKPEMLVLRWVLDMLFSQMDDAEYDEHLECAYQKLYDAWPVEPPYFVKRDNLSWPI